MKKTLLTACAATVLNACSTTHHTELTNSQSYQVEWIGERPLIDSSMLTLRLTDDKQATGLAGCNNWSANYQLNGNSFSLSDITTTRKLCAPALMEQEQRFLAYLARVQRWEFAEHQQLLLWPEQGEPIKLWSIENQRDN